MKMTLVDTNKAVEYFQNKMEFTTGPFELKSLIDSGENINIIDVRLYEDFVSGHIPSSVNLPREKWETLEGLSHDRNNIVYCYSDACHLSAAAALLFAERGFSVIELDGGFDEWKRHGLPLET
ncbi:MAG: rhodanese-like domain-containing protein [Planctomycetes bacterium]|nr:rhodanese-like domain-containing protein [Planctomycetota bacterium]